MPAPKNHFKEKIALGERQIGCWLAMGEGFATEIAAGAGFDWLLIDGEHGPNDIRSISRQLGTTLASSAAPMVRVPALEPWVIKQVLDAGAQNVLIPMVNNRAEAEAAVAACKYPPHGIRGVGAMGTRATNFGEVTDYTVTANDEICVIVQVESREAYENLDDILATPGVDGVFVGPADLSADMGFLGRANDPAFKKIEEDALTRIRAAGKPSGMISTNAAAIERYMELDITFIAVGMDVPILAQGMRKLVKTYKG